MIESILIHDVDESFAPPEQQVLSVSVVNDVVFLAIGHYEDGSQERKFTTNLDQQIAVDGVVLASAIATALDASNAAAKKRA